MELNELVLKRQSQRSYDKSKTVEKQDVEEILKLAMLAPSACNSQPWSFTVVQGDLADEVGKCCREFGGNKFTEEVNTFIVVTEEKAKLVERVLQHVKDNAFCEIDIGLSVAHLILAATDRGLSTCIMGLFKEDKVKKLLGIDLKKRVRLVISLGYAKESDTIRQKTRKPFEEVVTFK